MEASGSGVFDDGAEIPENKRSLSSNKMAATKFRLGVRLARLRTRSHPSFNERVTILFILHSIMSKSVCIHSTRPVERGTPQC